MKKIFLTLMFSGSLYAQTNGASLTVNTYEVQGSMVQELTTIANLHNNLPTRVSTIETQMASLSSLQSDNTALAGQVNGLISRIEELEATILDLDLIIAGLEVRIEALEP